MPPKPIRKATLLTLALGLAVLCLWGLRSRAQPAHSILIVLDTVRADRLSLCGYDRPTSPTLESLARTGFTSTCEAYTPGTWTLPSHASFFTGVDVLTHRAHALTDGIDDLSGTQARTRKLQDKRPTLAEQMAQKGYQSMALSGNPVINDGLGLTRGFEVARIAEKFGKIAEDRLVSALQELLLERDTSRPTFLFVNIAEAHQPWKAVPSSVEWASARRSLKYNKLKEDDPWRRFSEGRMGPEQEKVFRERIDDLYDYNLWLADRTLGDVIEVLDTTLCRADCRIVITSDHGEFLGEHGLLDHGNYVWQADTRVPFLYRGAGGPSRFPEPLNALHAFHLARDGVLPDELAPPETVAWPHVRRCARTSGRSYCSTSASIWTEDEMLLWMDGSPLRFDRTGDRDSLDPEALGEHPFATRLTQLALRVSEEATGADGVDMNVIEALRAAGYVD